jgi:hypothetical protein
MLKELKFDSLISLLKANNQEFMQWIANFLASISKFGTHHNHSIEKTITHNLSMKYENQ